MKKAADSIPKGKVRRAAKIVSTGVKVGVNYVDYYSKKAFNKDLSRDYLDEKNAEDIYESLSELKGSALKMAQMMSMDRKVLPKAYVDRFSLAQFNVPPLSGPLVQKTFLKYFGKTANQLFDTFTPEAVNAASIGQVHKATNKGQTYAVKVQYPGVADSVKSDLRLVKPFAIRMFDLKGQDIDKYFKEVEGKLLEETNYDLELKRSQFISEQCKHLPGVVFPTYYNDMSSERILTMDWIHGQHLSEFTKTEQDQDKRNQIGQYLWDFFLYQMHKLKMVHADPHPGNFIVTADNKLGIIDFGCVKEIPQDFYEGYFALTKKENLQNIEKLELELTKLEILKPNDSGEEHDFFRDAFQEVLSKLSEPFWHDEFDFGNDSYFDEIFELGERIGREAEKRKYGAGRGSQHFLYLNRTFFGVYTILWELKAQVKISEVE